MLATTKGFGQDTAVVSNEKSLNKTELQQLLKSPGLKVFVMAPDAAALTHATNALQYSTGWQLVGDKSLAQVIVRFSFAAVGMGDKKGKAQFLDPKTEALIFETRTVSTAFSWDMNSKRGVIDRIVNKEIKKLIKDSE